MRRERKIKETGIKTVSILDAGGFSAHWYPGPPVEPSGYSANADINNDGAVDIFDAVLVSAHWLQSWRTFAPAFGEQSQNPCFTGTCQKIEELREDGFLYRARLLVLREVQKSAVLGRTTEILDKAYILDYGSG